MPITVNEGGALKTLTQIPVNEGGVLYNLDRVHANEGGVLHEIYSSQLELLGEFGYRNGLGVDNAYNLSCEQTISIKNYPFTADTYSLSVNGDYSNVRLNEGCEYIKRNVDLSHFSVIHLDASFTNPSDGAYDYTSLEVYNAGGYDSREKYILHKSKSAGTNFIWDLDVSALNGLYDILFHVPHGRYATNYYYDVTINEWYLR